MSLASAWAVALHKVGGVLVEIEAQYSHLTAVVAATSSTGLLSDAAQRTSPAHAALRSGTPPAAVNCRASSTTLPG
jgi:hypothetical protein